MLSPPLIFSLYIHILRSSLLLLLFESVSCHINTYIVTTMLIYFEIRCIYTGPPCDNLCFNGGTCDTSGTCVCAAGFTGPSCNNGLCPALRIHLMNIVLYIPLHRCTLNENDSNSYSIQRFALQPVGMVEHVNGTLPLPRLNATVLLTLKDLTANTKVHAYIQCVRTVAAHK